MPIVNCIERCLVKPDANAAAAKRPLTWISNWPLNLTLTLALNLSLVVLFMLGLTALVVAPAQAQTSTSAQTKAPTKAPAKATLQAQTKGQGLTKGQPQSQAQPLAQVSAQTRASAKKTSTFPVLVECFDSTTPEAQKLFPQIISEVTKNPQVVFLDYRLGPISDRKSNVDFSQRRTGYACIFGAGFVKEPGLVVDGEKKSCAASLAADIATAGGAEKLPVTLSAQSIYNQLDIKASYVDVKHLTFRTRAYFAIVEDDPSDKTAGGASSIRRIGVVRKILDIGFIVSDQGAKLNTHCQIEPGWKKRDLRVVMFVQDPLTKRVPLCASCPVKVQD